MSSAVDTGYDLDRFNSPVPHGLKCSICKNVLKNPKLCKDEGHPFCDYCIHEWLKRKENCAECKNTLTPETLVAPPKCFSRLLGSLKISCDYQERGCYSRISLGSLQDHVRRCEFAPVTCEKCGIQINRKDEKKHEENFCPIEPIIKCKLSEITKKQDEYILKTNAVFSQVQVMTDTQRQMKKRQIEMKEKMGRAEKAQKEEMESQMPRTRKRKQNEIDDRVNDIKAERESQMSEVKRKQDEIDDRVDNIENDVREMKQQFDLLSESFDRVADQPFSTFSPNYKEIIITGRFLLEVLWDYESGALKGHSQQEFLQAGIKLKELKGQIENKAQVNEKKEVIEKRSRINSAICENVKNTAMDDEESNMKQNMISEARSLALQYMSENPSCIRAIPYGEDAKSLTMCLYMDTNGKRIPEKIKMAAKKMFENYQIEFVDLFRRPLNKIVTQQSQSKNSNELDEIYRKIEKNLHLFENRMNVTAVQASYKITESKEQDIPCVTVYVIDKGKIPAGETDIRKIKEENSDIFNETEFDVAEGYYKMTNGSSLEGYASHLHGGVGIGVKGENRAGTLGGFLEDEEGNVYILSSKHVIHHSDAAEDVIVQPSELDYKNMHSEIETELHRLTEKINRIRASNIGESNSVLEEMERNRMEAEKTLDKIKSKQPRRIGKCVCGVKDNHAFGDIEVYVDAAIATLDEDQLSAMKDYKDWEVEENRCPLYGFETEELCKWMHGDYHPPNGEIIDFQSFQEHVRTERSGEPSELRFMKIGKSTGFTDEGRFYIPKERIHLHFMRSEDITGLVHIQNSFREDCFQIEDPNHDPTLEADEGIKKCRRCEKEFPNSGQIRSFWAQNCYLVGKERKPFSEEGDSGALVFDNQGRAWGLAIGYFANSTANLPSVISPLWAVLDALKERSGRKELKLWFHIKRNLCEDVKNPAIGDAESDMKKEMISEARSLALQFMFENPSCIRAIPYEREDAKSLTMCLYMDTNGKRIPEEIKAAAKDKFKNYEIKFDDLYRRPLNKIVRQPPASQKQKAKELADLSKTIEKNLHLFDNRMNITAVKASYKVTDSIEHDIPCVTVYVVGKGKIPAGETDINEIKKENGDLFNETKFDVAEGYYKMTTGSSLEDYAKPIKGGVGIGVKGVPAAGTLGGFLEDEEGNVYILSNEHVLHPYDAVEDIIVQPSELDYDYKRSTSQKKITRLTSKIERIQGNDDESSQLALKEFEGDRDKEKKIFDEIKKSRPIGKYVCGVKGNYAYGGFNVYVDAAIAKLEEKELSVMKVSKNSESEANRCPLYGFETENYWNPEDGNYPKGEIIDFQSLQADVREEWERQNKSSKKPSKLRFMKIGKSTGFTDEGCFEIPHEQIHLNIIPGLVRAPSSFCEDCIQLEHPNYQPEENEPNANACQRCGKKFENPGQVRSFWAKNCYLVEKRTEPFSKEGDSGALVFDNQGRAWGLAFALFDDLSQHRLSLISPLWVALDALKKELKKRHGLRELKLWCTPKEEPTHEMQNTQASS